MCGLLWVSNFWRVYMSTSGTGEHVGVYVPETVQWPEILRQSGSFPDPPQGTGERVTVAESAVFGREYVG